MAVVLEQPLSPRECAKLAGVHYHTILRRIRAGHLKAFQPPGGQEYVVHPEDFAAWLYGSPVQPRPEDAPAPATSTGGPPAVRGSLAALDAIERGAA